MIGTSGYWRRRWRPEVAKRLQNAPTGLTIEKLREHLYSQCPLNAFGSYDAWKKEVFLQVKRAKIAPSADTTESQLPLF